MSDGLGLVVGMLTASTLVLGLLGMAVRFVLVPYLERNLVRPLAETRHQVTANQHASPNPTVPDRLEDMHTDLRAFARAFDGHLEWSQNEVDRLWKALSRKADRQ